jgi:hypothetical protein
MPFPQQTPRAFTRPNIEAINPGQQGCYGLFREGVWVYVGRGDIRERLLDHLSGTNSCIARQQPTHWVDTVTADSVAEEKRLIAELTPVCNQKVG